MPDNEQGTGGQRSARRERLRRILSAVHASSSIRLNKLAEEFGVSTETIRRDLDKLSGQGLINRTYGGAAAASPGTDPTFSERLETNAKAREAIARLALRLVNPGDVIFLSSGVTSLQFARQLSLEAGRMTVLTTSLRVAVALGANPSIRVIVAPGDYDAMEAAVTGPETCEFISRFRATTMFFGASGLTAEGPYESRSGIAWNLRTMIENAQRVVLLIDQTKFEVVHLERISSLADLDVVVTDQIPDQSLAEAIEAAGIELCIALEGL